MKNMRKLATLLLALVMLFTLAVSASADEPDAPTLPEHTITINNSQTGHTYEAYQVFKGTISNDKLVEIDWGTGVKKDELLSALKADATIGSLFANASDAEDVAEIISENTFTAANVDIFAQIVGDNLGTTAAGISTAVESGEYTIKVNGDGYYIVKDKDNKSTPSRNWIGARLRSRRRPSVPVMESIRAALSSSTGVRSALIVAMAFMLITAPFQSCSMITGQSLKDRTDYAQNPEKTEKGELVTGYQCDPMTVDEEFLLSKRQYQHITGKHPKNDVIAYQIRQSFKPGEITAEEANAVGMELAERFTKGKHAFLVATHTDRAHIHNHIIFNSTSLDCTHKFKNFYFSGLAVQRLSDIICMEHGLSIIENVPYSQRAKKAVRENRVSHRDVLRELIDSILKEPPKNFPDFLSRLEENGYEVRRGKFISVRGKGQQRFIRLCSLGEGYTEEDIQTVISGTKQHHSRKKKPVILENQKFKLLVEIDERIRAKGPGYQRWATTYNLKQMAKTRIFLKEQGIGSMEELQEKADTAASEFDRIAKNLKAAEQRLVEIAALKKHIVNYAKTRDAYIAYRKAGYSKTFFEAHREEITLHKAAKDAFEKMNVSKLPTVKALSEEYASTLTQKKALYAQYRLVREQMQEYQKAVHNTEVFFELSEKEAACHQREHEKENSEEPNRS